MIALARRRQRLGSAVRVHIDPSTVNKRHQGGMRDRGARACRRCTSPIVRPTHPTTAVPPFCPSTGVGGQRLPDIRRAADTRPVLFKSRNMALTRGRFLSLLCAVGVLVTFAQTAAVIDWPDFSGAHLTHPFLSPLAHFTPFHCHFQVVLSAMTYVNPIPLWIPSLTNPSFTSPPKKVERSSNVPSIVRIAKASSSSYKTTKRKRKRRFAD